jgi:hypothetical protein
MPNYNHWKIILLGLAVATSGRAQEAGAPPEAAAAESEGAASFLDSSPEALGGATDQALKSAQDYVTKKGWIQGTNPDGRYVAVGSAPITVPPAHKDFPERRINAYTNAMLDAKAGMAKFLATDIKTEVAHYYGTESAIRREREARESAQNNKNAGLLAKVRLLVMAKLDKALEQEGVALDSGNAAGKAGALLNHDSFSQLIENSAEAAANGIICGKIFEQDGRMAVVAYYTDNSRALAAALAGDAVALKTTPRKGAPLAQWIAALTPAELYPSFGVQITNDEAGGVVLLSYGQAVAQSESPNAIRNAREAAAVLANGYIRQFAGTMVTYDSVLEKLEQTREFDTGVVNGMAESFQETAIKEVGDRLKISGLQKTRDWETKDKRSGRIICGVVVRWSFASAQAARKMTGTRTESTLDATAKGANGGGNNKYKTESLESLDF